MLKVGEKVEWQWLGRKIPGIVIEIHVQKIVRTIKGKRITRNGTKENPAYVVKSEAGNLALKLGTELAKRSTSLNRKTPSMFSD